MNSSRCRYYGRDVPREFSACASCTVAQECYDAWEAGPKWNYIPVDGEPLPDPELNAWDGWKLEDIFARLVRNGDSRDTAAAIVDGVLADRAKRNGNGRNEHDVEEAN